MAKRSKRCPVRQSKDQAGCMWGLISIFDFRHGRFTKKLLSDRRHVTKNTVAAAYITSKLNILTNSDELCQTSENVKKSEKPISDGVKTSVKELMEEEMFTEEGSKKQVNSAEVELFDSKNHNRTNRTFKKPCDIHENSDIQLSAQRTSSYLDLEGMMEELLLIHQKSTGLDMQSNQTYSVVQKKLSAAVDVLIKEKFTTGEIFTENGKILNSKDFIDALQILSSNKELFLKLLQDPNSLLSKHIRDLEDAQLEEDQKAKSMAGSNLLENKPSNSRPEELITRKHRTFFRRRSKSQESNPLKNDKSQLSSTIVILKPGHPDDGINVGTYDKMENEVQSGRNSSQFSFMEIKRKIKHAMGKERHSSDSEKGVVEGTVEWSSPNRNHFYTERFATLSNGFKKGDRVSELRDHERKIMENETNGDSKQRISNISIEAKKHLSEMLSNGNEDAELMIGSLPKSLGRILSLPEYSYSPSDSPLKEEHGFVTAQMRFCPQMVNESQPCISDDNPYEKVLNSDDVMEARESSMREEIGSEELVEILKLADIKNQEDGKALDDSCEPCSSLDTNEVVNDEIAAKVFDEERSSHHLKVELPEENESSSSPPASPLSSSLASNKEELESAIDKNGRPSPISVLEPLFSEDDISPASNSSRPVQTAIQPLHIQFEEIVSSATNQEICIGTCTENEEYAFEYVEAVLLASDLNWDEFLMRWLSSHQILDPSLFDEVELFSNSSCLDQRLLFDCTNEILKVVCDSYFVKQNIRPVPKGMKLINEVWEGIESLLLDNPYPRSLEQLVRKDLGKFGTWMDLHLDTEAIVCEMEESILEGLMDDTFLILVNDCIDEEFCGNEDILGII